MKKAKKIVLLYFMHQQVLNSRSDNSITYDELYEAIPLSPSTIRGIIQEFLQERLIRPDHSREQSAWILANSGENLSKTIFTSLYDFVSAPLVTILIFPKNTRSVHTNAVKILLGLPIVQVDSHSWLAFGWVESSALKKLNARSRVPIVSFMQSIADEKAFTSYLFQTTYGQKAYTQRQKILSKKVSLQRIMKRYSPSNINMRKNRLNIFADIISAFQDGSIIPEQYYPHEMRMVNIISKIW